MLKNFLTEEAEEARNIAGRRPALFAADEDDEVKKFEARRLRRRAQRPDKACPKPRHFGFFSQGFISVMSLSRPAREPRPPHAKRPRPTDPPKRTIGCILGSDSYGTNSDIWDVLVLAGFIPKKPVCKYCARPVKFDKEKEKLHFSLICSKCRKRTNVFRKTDLFQVKNIREFFGALEGWCNGDLVANIRARLGLSRDAWRSYKQIFESAVSNVIVRAGETPEGQLGGVGIVVEVDECHVHSRKFNRGNPLASEKLWVVGVMERTPNADGGRKAAFFVTVKRDEAPFSPSSENGSRPDPS